MKVKEIKEVLKQFDDDDKVLIECCIDDQAKNGTYKNEIINGYPFQIELCNFDICNDGDLELMFNVKEYK